MYKKILVPLDGSELSECVLDHVRAIAQGCSVPSVVALYVIEPVNPGMYEVPVQMLENANEQGKHYGTAYLNRVVAKMKEQGLEVEPVLMSGRVVDSILDYARENGVDLIAMSTHGRSGLSRLVLGSVAEKVVRHASIPVFLVPPAETSK